MKYKPLGRTQRKIYSYILQHPGCTVKEIGDAIYESTSSCANEARPHIWSKERIRHHWARTAVWELKKKNMIYRDAGNGLWGGPKPKG